MTNNKTNVNGNGLTAGIRGGDVVCFGLLTHTLLIRVDELPEHNGGVPILGSLDSLGDDAAIAASILTRWDVPTRLITNPTGNDSRGEVVREHLDAWGVNVRQDTEIIDGMETPFEVSIIDPVGARTYFQRRDPAAMAELTPPDPSQIKNAGLLYVDWYDGPSVVHAARDAVAQGVPVYVNLESEYDSGGWVANLIGDASICQVSLDTPEAADAGDPAAIARSLIDRGVEMAVVTLGADGCVVARGQEAYHIRPPQVDVIDCNGAGAACSAGIMYGLWAGWPLEDIGRYAAAYAGLKCGINGLAELDVSDVQKTAAALPSQRLPL